MMAGSNGLRRGHVVARLRVLLEQRVGGEPEWMKVADAALHFGTTPNHIYRMRYEGLLYSKGGPDGILVDVVNPVSPEPQADPDVFTNTASERAEQAHTYTVTLSPEEAEALVDLAASQCRAGGQQITWMVRCALKAWKLGDTPWGKQ